MRITGRLATSTIAAGLVAGLIVAVAPTARASTSEETRPTATVSKDTASKDTAGRSNAGSNTPAPNKNTASKTLTVRARAAELANEATGADLWSRASTTEHPMGSIAKIMTAYVVIEAGNLNRVITVPSGIVAYDKKYAASTAGLAPGEKLTALQLLYALLLPSGCDAAYTLAAAYGKGGRLTDFIAQMNASARKLGLTKTHFSDFSGLPDPSEHSTYSTARDLVSLGRDAMRLAVFRQVVATRTYRVPPTSHNDPHVWVNLDPLLTRYSGATGIKTGFTTAAGDCLLFAATRGRKELIGVVLDSSAADSTAGLNVAASDAEALLNWGFSK